MNYLTLFFISNIICISFVFVIVTLMGNNNAVANLLLPKIQYVHADNIDLSTKNLKSIGKEY